MGLRVQRFKNGDLYDRNICLRVHNNEWNKDSMVISPLCISLKLHSFLCKLWLNVVSQFRSAADGISQVIGLSRESIVIIIKGRVIWVNHRPLVFFPVRWKQYYGLRLGVLFFNLLKLLIELSMVLLVDERHGSSTVGDKDWSHTNDFMYK